MRQCFFSFFLLARAMASRSEQDKGHNAANASFFLLHCEQTCHPITAAVMVCLLRRHHRQNTASEVTLCLDSRQKKRRNVKRKIKNGQVAIFCLLKRQNVSERTSCSPSGIPKTCASLQSQLFRDDGDAKRVILSSRFISASCASQPGVKNR